MKNSNASNSQSRKDNIKNELITSIDSGWGTNLTHDLLGGCARKDLRKLNFLWAVITFRLTDR